MLIIGNGRVVTRDSANPYIESGAVAIEGTQIKKVGDLETLKKEFPDAEFIDAKGRLSCRHLLMHMNIFIVHLQEVCQSTDMIRRDF